MSATAPTPKDVEDAKRKAHEALSKPENRERLRSRGIRLSESDIKSLEQKRCS